ncbi:type II toxin-antitoxin system VapC family toxin [Candidatus Pacearchaeota archaeon]|nr:type II toxin-antitoxin system VapC family toxin [Candidatus Pacearchaeota archaeon]
MVKYFLDTYALIEIANANEKFRKYTAENAMTSSFNLYELYYNLLKEMGKEQAQEYYQQFKQVLLKYNDETIFQASVFKQQHQKRRISYTDALGYILAQQNNLLFVTGDKEFEHISGVEFLKK